MHYYKFNIADYRKDTVHLTRAEHSIYRDLIDWYYMDEKPISSDIGVIIRRLRLNTEEEKQALNNVLTDFFQISDLGYRHLRIDEEISEYHKKADLNKKNGKKGGRPPKKEANKTQNKPNGNPEETQKNPDGFQTVPRRFPEKTQTDATQNPNVTLTNNHKPLTNNQEYKNICPSGDERASPRPPCRFNEFWSVYPIKQKKKDAKKIWDRKKLNEKAQSLIDDVINRTANDQNWIDGYVPHPTTYFNGERWNDELKKPIGRHKKQNSNGVSSGSALDKVLAGISSSQGNHEQTMGHDDPALRASMDQQLWSRGGPAGCVGSVIEGDFARHD